MADDYLSTLFASKPAADPSDPTGEFAADTASGVGPGTLEETKKKTPQVTPLPQVLPTPKPAPTPAVTPTPPPPVPQPPPTPAPTPRPGWLDKKIVSTQSGIATTFASPSDLEAYKEAKRQGKTEQEALRVGDNGVGSAELGSIETPKAYGVAVPESVLEGLFGYDPEAWRKARVQITVGDHEVTVPIVDLGPGETAKARGVITDYTDLLGKALGAKGFDQTNITIVANAGPDYINDRAGWDGEQARIKKSLGISEPWTDKSKRVAAPGEEAAKPWADKSKRVPAPGEEAAKSKEVAAPGEAKPPWMKKRVPAPEETLSHPIAQANGLDLNGTMTGIWDSYKVLQARNNYRNLVSQLQTNKYIPDEAVENQVAQIQASPYLTPEQKETNIQALRDGQSTEIENVRKQIPIAEAQVKEAEAQFKKDHPANWQQILASVSYYAPNAFLGPVGAINAAQLASAEAYGEVLDKAVTQNKKLHPDWSNEQILNESIKAAMEGSRASGGTMLALGFMDLPVYGSLLSRLAKKATLGVLTMEIGNTFAEAQKNMALKAHADPNQDILEGLRDLDFHLTNVGTALVFAGAHEIGRPSTKPIEQRVAGARAQVDATEEAKVKPGAKAETVDDNGEIIRDIEGEVISVEPVRKEIGVGPKLLEDKPPDPVTDKLTLLKLPDNKVTRAIATRALRADEGNEALIVSAVRDNRTGQIVTNERGHLLAMRELLGRVPTPEVLSWTQVPGGLEREQEGPKPDYVDYGYLTNTGRFVTSPMDLARQKEAEEKPKFPDRYAAAGIKEPSPIAELGIEIEEPPSPPPPRKPPPGREDLTPPDEIPEREISRGLDIPGSQFWLPMREVIENSPHTGELVRAIDEYRALLSDFLGQHAILDYRLKQLIKMNPELSRGAFPQDRRGEIDYIGFYIEQNGKLPDKYSPEADEWMQKANQGLYRKYADMMRAGRFKVLNPVTGKWELFRGAPPDVVPFKRRMRPDVQNLLAGKITKGPPTGRPLTRDDLVPAAQKLYDEGLKTIDKNTGEPFFSKPEDLLEWARHYDVEKQHHTLGSIERKRVTKYPSFFYTYSPEAMLDTMYWQAHEVARLMAFGQQTDVDDDLFTITLKAIDADHSISEEFKTRSMDAVKSLQNYIYGGQRTGATSRILAGLTSRLAASPHTSLKIMVSLPGMGAPYIGVVNELRGILRSIFQRPDAIEEIRREGLLTYRPLDIYDDPYTRRTRLENITRFFTRELRAALHGLVYDQGRMATYHGARLKIDQIIRRFQRDPTLRTSGSKKAIDLIEATGMDYREFLRPEVREEAKRRFAREITNDVQVAYRKEDQPYWANLPDGKVMFRFGDWTYNAASVVVRYIALPMAKAVRRALSEGATSSDWALVGRYFGQLFATFLGTAIATSEAWRAFDEMFFGKQGMAATNGEIMRRLYQHDPEAFAMIQDRLWQDIIGSPIIGIWGDIANVVQGIWRGEVDTVHTFNPFMPATISMFGALFQTWSHFQKQGMKLSDRQIWDLTYTLAAIVRGYYDLAESTVSKFGISLPGHAEAEGRRDYQFVRNRVDLFYRLHPTEPGKPEHGFGVSTLHTPYLQNLQEALLSGNVERAKGELQKLYKLYGEQGLTKKKFDQGVTTSVRDHKPIPPGEEGKTFVNWARKALPDDEWNRMVAIEKKYLKTAQEAGIPVHD